MSELFFDWISAFDCVTFGHGVEFLSTALLSTLSGIQQEVLYFDRRFIDSYEASFLYLQVIQVHFIREMIKGNFASITHSLRVVFMQLEII